MFLRIAFSTAITVLLLLMTNCQTDRTQPLAGDLISPQTDNSSDDLFDNNTGINKVDANELGVGPEVIPDGSKKVGTSDLEDGSAARRTLYGIPQYFWGNMGKGQEIPLVKITHAVNSKIVDIEVIFNPAFVDNTYGTGSIGWKPNRGHTFKDLYASDHVELAVTNNNGETVWKGKLDFLSVTSSLPSGYASLGPFGGDGQISIGDGSSVLSFGSSLDDNINYYGYQLFQNSPQTDSTFKVNSQYPKWQFFVVYRVSFDASVFGSSGYGKVEMTSVHASPSKGNDTVPVKEKPGPVPGSPEDPFKYYNPYKTVIPGDDPDIPEDSIPVIDPDYDVG